MSALQRRWPLRTDRGSFAVGGAWALLTLVFEFGLGRARGLSWQEMAADYDVTRGRTWVAVPAFLIVGPAWVRRRQGAGAAPR